MPTQAKSSRAEATLSEVPVQDLGEVLVQEGTSEAAAGVGAQYVDVASFCAVVQLLYAFRRGQIRLHGVDVGAGFLAQRLRGGVDARLVRGDQQVIGIQRQSTREFIANAGGSTGHSGKRPQRRRACSIHDVSPVRGSESANAVAAPARPCSADTARAISAPQARAPPHGKGQAAGGRAGRHCRTPRTQCHVRSNFCRTCQPMLRAPASR